MLTSNDFLQKEPFPFFKVSCPAPPHIHTLIFLFYFSHQLRFLLIYVYLVLQRMMYSQIFNHYSGADSVTQFLVISVSQSLNVTLIRIANLNVLHMTDQTEIFACYCDQA